MFLLLDHIDLLSLPPLAAVAVGYVLGSLPFGFWVGRAYGVNIFELGSRSPGATNVRRVLGARAGNLVFVLDALKGAVAAGWPLYFVWRVGPVALAEPVALAAAHDLARVCGAAGLIGALLGHSFSLFTRFRGGKGVATVAGGFLVLMPVVTLICAALWTAVFYATRYVSTASILAAVALPLVAAWWGMGQALVAVAAVLSAFIIFLHRANIARLLRGTEHRFGRKTGAVAAGQGAAAGTNSEPTAPPELGADR
jgi:glycerol-3-phosphate acyltransferase PlsY